MSECTLCPRRCLCDRNTDTGVFCGETNKINVSRAMLHMWEEPPISGVRGTGAIFFCGCSLGCIYCQNKTISRIGASGHELSEEGLAELIFTLRGKGAHSIDLVTPTHFADALARVLERVKPTLGIPVVYNTSGYETVETLKMLDGLVDVYLPDFKYASSELASLYSNAPDYPEVAAAAISEMFRQTGKISFDNEGIAEKGVIVRHLVLPACRKDSIAVLDTLASTLPVSDIRLSLMSQYTPEFALECEHKNLHRKITSFEYNSVLEHALSLGFEGYFQQRSSASKDYTPDFENVSLI